MKIFPLVVAFFLGLFLSSSLWAEWPDRVVELDVHSEAGISNNYFPISAFFNNPLVVDFNAMAQTLNPEGFTVSTLANSQVRLSITPTNDLQFGLFGGAEIYGLATIPEAILSFLANGTGPNGSTSSAGWTPQNFKGDVFFDFGLNAGLKWKKWHFSLSPTYFVPLLHIDAINVSYSLSTSSSGTTAITQATIPVYSVVGLPNSTSSTIGPPQISGGFDLTAEADYAFYPWLTVGGRLVNLPLVPAQMTQGSILQATETVTTVDPSTNSGNPFKTTSTSSWTQTLGTISVIRPFEARAVVSLYPFSDPWLSFTPSLGVGVWNGVYLIGGLKMVIDGRHWAHLSFNSDYQYGLWSQMVGLGLNVRLFEVDLAVGGTSTDFVQSFTDGVMAAVDVKLGF